MTRVFVYEYLSGGGVVAGSDAASDELMPMGVAMRDAIVGDLVASDGCEVTVATCAGAGPVPSSVASAHARRDESPFDFVARQAALHDVAWIVAPETDGLLGRFCDVVGRRRWLGCDAAAIALTTSKRATLERLACHGIATPLAFTEARRWVVKPDDGAGSVDTRWHDDPATAVAAARRPGMTLEPWVEGDAWSLSLACRGDVTELLSVNRQRIRRAADGSLSFEGVEVHVRPADDALRALASRVAAAIGGLRGFVGIDLVWHPQRGPVVIEVNPRVTCAYVGLSSALGRNLGAEAIAAWRTDHFHSTPDALHA